MMIQVTKMFVCSDGRSFEDEGPARRHERRLAIRHVIDPHMEDVDEVVQVVMKILDAAIDPDIGDGDEFLADLDRHLGVIS